MKLPERGILRVTGVHEGHSHSRISGIITAPGIAPTRVEHKIDERGRCAAGQDLAVLVDCADPSRFVILWDEAVNATGAPSSFQYGPGADVFIGSEGQPYSAALPQDMAARVEGPSASGAGPYLRTWRLAWNRPWTGRSARQACRARASARPSTKR
jgi:hypothetical protein